MCSEGTTPELREEATEEEMPQDDIELAGRVGSTLASIGDNLDNRYRRRNRTENVPRDVINNLTRTLMAVLFFEQSDDTLH